MTIYKYMKFKKCVTVKHVYKYDYQTAVNGISLNKVLPPGTNYKGISINKSTKRYNFSNF